MKWDRSQPKPIKSLAEFPEHNPQSPLSIHDMTVAYRQRPVLWDIEYDAPNNCLIAIVGPNGAGKSTLIKACLNLIPKVSGRVEFWGKTYKEQMHQIGYVPQRESVDWDFPVSALDVVCMGRYRKIGWFRRVNRKHKEQSLFCLEQVGMADLAHRQINQLSGGQQQRVFLARALAQEAKLYFMDEPFAGVDAATEKAIVEVLRCLQQEGRTVICVHHDLPTVPNYFDHVLLINTRIVAAGPVEQVFNRDNLHKTYGGRLTLLDEVAEAMARASRGQKIMANVLAGMEHTSITDVSVTIPSGEEIWRVLTLQAGYNSAVVVVGTTFLGIAAGIIGTFALLRKRALMGDALSHAALPGLAIAFLVSTFFGREGKSLPVLLTGAAITGVLAVLTIQFLVRNTRLKEDTAIGAVLSVFFGLGITLLSVIQTLKVGNQSGLHHFIYGQTAAISREDALITAGVAILSMFVATFFLKEFRLVCFNDEFAAVQGWPVSLIDIVMMSLVVVVTVIGLQAVGLILIVALLIIPAAAARFWTERFGVMTFLSGILGGLSGYLGSTASSLLPRLPTGSVIVLTGGVLFTISLFFAPARGVIANLLRIARLRLKVAKEHLLRGMYEIMEKGWEEAKNSKPLKGGQEIIIAMKDLEASRSWSKINKFLLIRYLAFQGMIQQRGEHLRLSTKGKEEALLLTRNHRLWEEFLLTYTHLAASHVDRSADRVEHVLSKEMVRELEDALREKGQLPDLKKMIPSAHPLGDL